MISFEMEDLIGVLQGLVPYFIAIGLALAVAIAVSIAVKKLPKNKEKAKAKVEKIKAKAGMYFKKDHTHASKAGALLNAESVARGLRQNGSKLAEYLKND